MFASVYGYSIPAKLFKIASKIIFAPLQGTATDKDAVIDKIAWHIPTGGPKSIKVHHKAKIVKALKALK